LSSISFGNFESLGKEVLGSGMDRLQIKLRVKVDFKLWNKVFGDVQRQVKLACY